MEMIKIKRIQFNNGAPDFIFSIHDWYANGGYRGIIKDNSLCIADIKHVLGGTMLESEYSLLPAWEG